MLAIDTSGVPEYTAWLDKQAVALRLEVQEVFRSWCVAIHREIAELTPQWSGNLAANWAIDIGSPSTTAQELGDPSVRTVGSTDSPAFGRDPYSRGMQPAVQESLARGQRLQLPGLAESVYIHNPVTYAAEVEEDSGARPIRAINRVPRSETGKVAMVYHAYFKHLLDGEALLNELRSRPS
jgi:hypothetical protein